MNKLAVIVSLVSMATTLGAQNKRAPLPDKLVNARTVYLDNRTGDQKLADSVYSQASAWGRWEFVTDRSKANILIVLSYDENSVAVVAAASATAVGHSATGSGFGIPIQYYVYLHVVDRENGEGLWTAKSRVKVGASRTAGKSSPG